MKDEINKIIGIALTERLESKLGKSKLSEDINNAENKFKSKI